MKVTLSKEDIETIIKEYFDMESVAWQKDGTIILDTTLEKITNEKNKLGIFNEKLGITKKNPQIIGTSYPYTPSWGGTITSTNGVSNIKKYTKTTVKK